MGRNWRGLKGTDGQTMKVKNIETHCNKDLDTKLAYAKLQGSHAHIYYFVHIWNFKELFLKTRFYTVNLAF